ncbi:MAG: energy transducer TonB, partial [Gammaproteobacteria bacterium]|nr:energy transducer TonB [Gammaproteobacteria bacterium]NNJ91832.1 energy transducer TonB [Gammaproteobacteria bacterium]
PEPEPAVKEQKVPVSEKASPETESQPAALPAQMGILNKKLVEQYKLDLLRAIEANKKYPKRAKKRRQQGLVKVGFVIKGNGKITNVCVIESSGYKMLDQAAMAAVSAVNHFKPIPQGIYRDNWEFVVPVEYQLL